MSNSTTNLDLISASQAAKEITANSLFDAASPATLFGRRARTTEALTWGYYGGVVNVSGTLTPIANGTVALSASTTNYVEANASGVVSKNTTAFTVGATPLYTVITGASTVSSYTDWRLSGGGSGGGGGGSGTVTSVALSVPGFLSVSGSPVTTNGTLAISLATESANLIFSGPSSGSAANPTFRALVAADLPAQPYDVGAFYPGVPTASVVTLLHVFNRAVSFVSGLTGSHGVALVVATSTTNFDIKKNGSSIGTMSFAGSATTATFTLASATSFAAGDVLTVTAPGTPDATLASISFTLAGTR